MKENSQSFLLHPIGVVQSPLKSKDEAPRQGHEGAPDAWLSISSEVAAALEGLQVGQRIIVLTWLHLSDRTVLQMHPRSDPNNALQGVFATRSPDRPNPVGLHEVTVLALEGLRLKVGPIEAIDGTPVIDIKPVR